MGPARIHYIRDLPEMSRYCKRIKNVSCPHCASTGHLNRHGFLRGYGEEGHERIVRGRRFFCSNRGRRSGCGHTFSVLFSHLLRYLVVQTGRLWSFLLAIGAGLSVQASCEKHMPDFALQTGYRLWKRFLRSQPHIRTLLSRACPPPASSAKRSFIQVVHHLTAAFPAAGCPPAAFQEHFQRPFLT